MFRHQDKAPEPGGNPASAPGEPAAGAPAEKAGAEESVEELLKKNLKWSQIIYEQNRKINNKLLWSTIASWLYFVILIAPIVIGMIFLPPLLKNVWSQYADLLGTGAGQTASSSQSTIDNLVKMLNLNPAQQEQLKAILK